MTLNVDSFTVHLNQLATKHELRAQAIRGVITTLEEVFTDPGGVTVPTGPTKGKKNNRGGKPKLNVEQVALLRRMWATKNYSVPMLAKKLEVSRGTVIKALNGLGPYANYKIMK